MFKRLLLLAGLLLIVGCQQSAPPAYVAPPTLSPPVVVRPKPLPPQTEQHARQTPQTRIPYRKPPATGHYGSVARGWIPSAPPRAWRWIVIHHSDTPMGSAKAFDNYHRTVKHWDELGYHFVIGNGTGSGDGQVEVGSRWPKQKQGAHAGVKIYNEYGIGICLVGNFDVMRPSPKQMQSLAKLTAFLMRAYHIPPQNVIGHNQAKEGRTHCPGRYMNVASVRQMATRLAESDDLLPSPFLASTSSGDESGQ